VIHYPRKRWGQHFLSDTNLLLKLVRIINPQPEDSILEIGPGEGALTELLALKVKELIGIEIDKDLYQTLLSNKALSGCSFLLQDFLDVDLEALQFNGNRIRVVGNIPYQITSPILFRLLERPFKWLDIFLMVQKEVADRLTARVGTKTYGRLTVMVQAFMDVRQELTIPPDVFIPKPKVFSSFISLRSHNQFVLTNHTMDIFRKIVRIVFSQRRKMLKNSLHEILSGLDVETDIDLSRRPETLSVDEFIHLAYSINRGTS